MHLISLLDLSPEEFVSLVESGRKIGRKRTKDLDGRSVALLFYLPSTRTRVAFEVAVKELGGFPVYMRPDEMQLSRGERIKDTAQVLSSYVDCIVIRGKHSVIEDFSRNSRVPVVNALSELEHPCQLVADMITIRELKGKLHGLKLAWIGDGNNVCNSAILACSMCGIEMWVASPRGFEPKAEIVERGRKLGGEINVCNNPCDAVKDADVVYTDVWVSMGFERTESRIQSFQGFQVNSKLLELAKDDVIVLHCLPAHVGEEISEDVMDKFYDVIMRQSENKVPAHKAILKFLLC